MKKEVTLYTEDGKAVKAWKGTLAKKHWAEFSKIMVTVVLSTYILMVIVGVFDKALRGAEFTEMLEYTKEHTLPVLYGYIGKAFGENALKIIISHFWPGGIKPKNNNKDDEEAG